MTKKTTGVKAVWATSAEMSSSERIRMRALELALEVGLSSQFHWGTADILDAAREFETYIRRSPEGSAA